MATRTGQCMCGVVSFTARNVPSGFGACYCDMCRRWAGDRFVGVHVMPQDLQIKGGTDINTIRSSDWAERAFCRRCGSGLWYKLLAGPDAGSTSLSVGLLDDASGMFLAREFFVDRKSCLHALPEGREQMTTAQIMARYGPDVEGGA